MRSVADWQGPYKALRLVLLSDSHAMHRCLRVPDGDVLIHAGDFTMFNRRSSVLDFNSWLQDLPHRHKIVVPGNHEFNFNRSKWRDLITGAALLVNEGIEVGGIRIWGSPVTPADSGAFGGMTERDRRRIFSAIPEDTDVVITHSPPFGILDRESLEGEYQGCKEIAEAIQRVQPRLHVFGHIHGAYGVEWVGSTVFVNAALASVGYELTKEAITVDFDTHARAVVVPRPMAPFPRRVGARGGSHLRRTLS